MVTGGMGFIGSNFILQALSKGDGYEIVNLDDLRAGSNPSSLSHIRDVRYSFVRGSITDRDLVERLISKVDAVVNFAAETHVDRSIADPSSFMSSNVMGLFTILEAARKHKPQLRIIQISTDEVYGDIISGSFREESPLRASSPYSASKAAADLLALSYYRTYGLDICITRCTNNYGARQFPEKLIPKAIIRAMLGLDIPVYGNGTNVRDWIYVDDHCRAIELVLQEGHSGEVYNVSSGEERMNKQVVSKILELVGGRSRIENVKDRPGHDVRYSLDSSKLRGLGWRPSIGFDEGLGSTVSWYKENRDWWEPLADERVLCAMPWAT
jgi:dTDP-glucose 4,6-dehydratase